jgi:hypothetical protein
MQQSTTVSAVECKPIVVESVPWSWGFECALRGESVYTGYYFFCGRRFLEFERGHQAGQALAGPRGRPIMAKVLAEVAATMPGAPADLVAGMADVEMGATYTTPGIDWAQVEDERIGD